MTTMQTSFAVSDAVQLLRNSINELLPSVSQVTDDLYPGPEKNHMAAWRDSMIHMQAAIDNAGTVTAEQPPSDAAQRLCEAGEDLCQCIEATAQDDSQDGRKFAGAVAGLRRALGLIQSQREAELSIAESEARATAFFNSAQQAANTPAIGKRQPHRPTDGVC